MFYLATIGEALIDFVPMKKGFHLADVPQFERVAGGAPANVAAAFAKCGGSSMMLTKLGTDAFGEHIIDKLQSCGVDCDYIQRSSEHQTSLAFVSLAADGKTDYAFYRQNAADLALCYDEIEHSVGVFDMLHFCSVSLVESEMKKTHQKLLEEAIKHDKLISFDPNVRLALWDDHQTLKQTIHEFIPYANILKIADDELEFIMGTNDINEALATLWQHSRLQCVIYTRGKDGASVYTRTHQAHHEGFKVDVKDTTGAGDGFIAAFLWYLVIREQLPQEMDEEALTKGILFANAYAALSTKKAGAIDAYATMDELALFLEIYSNSFEE